MCQTSSYVSLSLGLYMLYMTIRAIGSSQFETIQYFYQSFPLLYCNLNLCFLVYRIHLSSFPLLYREIEISLHGLTISFAKRLTASVDILKAIIKTVRLIWCNYMYFYFISYFKLNIDYKNIKMAFKL